MRIALLTNFIPPYRKSLFAQLQEEVEELQIFLSTSMENNRAWNTDHGELNVTIQRSISYTKTWKSKQGFKEVTEVHVAYDTISQLQRYDPDIVISGELGMRSLLASLYCRFYNKPFILWLTLSTRTEAHKKGLRTALRKFLLNSADALLCNGNSCEQYVAALSIQKKTFFVPYTSDHTIRKTGKSRINPTRKMLYSGQLIERKGIRHMVSALSAWAKTNPKTTLELVVAGDGPEKKHFEGLNDLANIKYTLLGNVAYEALSKQYEEADLYIFPTLADEWGVVVNEALASGTPIVGSLYSQAVEELVVHEKNGWVFHPDQPEEYVNAIDMALSCSDAQLMEMSTQCIESIKNYTPKKVASTILEAAAHVRNA